MNIFWTKKKKTILKTKTNKIVKETDKKKDVRKINRDIFSSLIWQLCMHNLNRSRIYKLIGKIMANSNKTKKKYARQTKQTNESHKLTQCKIHQQSNRQTILTISFKEMTKKDELKELTNNIQKKSKTKKKNLRKTLC